MDDKQRTLLESDPEEYAALNVLYDEAVKQIASPDYTPIAPPPENKAPYYLINHWGLEMFRYGLELGAKIATLEQE